MEDYVILDKLIVAAAKAEGRSLIRKATRDRASPARSYGGRTNSYLLVMTLIQVKPALLTDEQFALM